MTKTQFGFILIFLYKYSSKHQFKIHCFKVLKGRCIVSWCHKTSRHIYRWSFCFLIHKLLLQLHVWLYTFFMLDALADANQEESCPHRQMCYYYTMEQQSTCIATDRYLKHRLLYMYITFIFRQWNKNKEILLRPGISRLRVWFGCSGDRGAADWVFPGAATWKQLNRYCSKE